MHQPGPGTPARLAKEIIRRGIRLLSPPTRRFHITLPSGLYVSFNAPRQFHIPRVLNGSVRDYEPNSIATALAIVESREGPFVDIGANIGVYSLCVASSLGRTCHAFEPYPAAANVLSDIARRYRLDIEVFRAAAGSTAGQADFYLSADSDMSNSLRANYRKAHSSIPVDVVTLDSAIKEAVSLIKIDTETTEADVLRGAARTLATLKPPLLIEILRTTFATEVCNILEPHGYKAYAVRASGELEPVTPKDAGKDQSERNWLFTTDPLSPAVLQRIHDWKRKIVA